VVDRAKAGDSSLNQQDIATARANLKNLPAQGHGMQRRALRRAISGHWRNISKTCRKPQTR
jgi:hypothetical protein